MIDYACGISKNCQMTQLTLNSLRDVIRMKLFLSTLGVGWISHLTFSPKDGLVTRIKFGSQVFHLLCFFKVNEHVLY